MTTLLTKSTLKEKIKMFNLFIRIGFADGFSLIIERSTYDYNNDFSPLIQIHGEIVHLDMDITS